jgi:hypothetical protein
MRAKGLTIAAVIWLCLTALQAPFAHYHPEDPDHHHATGLAHLHLGHLSAHHLEVEAEGAELDHGDEDKSAISQEWTPVAKLRIAPVYAAFALVSAAVVSFATVGVAPGFVVRSHDPPNRLASPARAPPV